MKFLIITTTLIALSGCSAYTYDNRYTESQPHELQHKKNSALTPEHRRNSDGNWIPSVRNERVKQQGCADNSVDCGPRILY